MEDASSLAWSGPARRALLMRIELTSTAALGLLVGLSFAIRTLAAWVRATPILFQDEYLYAQVGRSLAATGRPPVSGAGAHFPGLLQPLLTAPGWLVHDVGTAYRIVQAIDCLAVSLAAIPVFLLARRLGLSERISLAIAALALVVPDLVFSSFVLSEPVAYPAVLAALAAAVAALTRPTRLNQLAFVGFAILAALARIQFAFLPIVFLAAAGLVGLRERRVRAALREQGLVVAAFAVPALGLLAAGPSRVLGLYSGALRVAFHPLGALHWAALDGMTLLYASGWILVPGALLALVLILRQPLSRAELAFGAVTVLFVPLLLLEAGLVQADAPGADQIQERYVFYAVPLIALAFGSYARRGWPQRAPHLLLAAALVAIAARLPLAGYAVASKNSGSPFLYAVFWLEQKLGEPWLGSIAVAGAAALLSLVAVAASFRPRAGTAVALGLAGLACVAATTAAVTFDTSNATAARASFLPAQPSWIDHSGLRHVALLQSAGGMKTDAFDQLFWNRSIDRVLLLPGATPFERFQAESVHVGSDGTLLSGTRAIDQPLVVDDNASTVRLRGARPVAVGPTHTLWRPAGWPRLSLYMLGRYATGWLADSGRIMLWPDSAQGGLSGRVSFVAQAPAAADPMTLTFSSAGRAGQAVRLRPGVPVKITMPVCSAGPWSASFRSSSFGFVGGRPASVRATAPQFVADASACPAGPGSAY